MTGTIRPPDDPPGPRPAGEFPDILTPQQAADYLQVPLPTIYDWSSRGVLDPCGAKVKVGRHLRLIRANLLDCFGPEATGGR